MSTYLQSAKTLMSQGMFIQAMEFLQAEIEANPQNEEAYMLLSDCYIKLGDIKRGESVLYSLLAIDPTNSKAQTKLQRIKIISSAPESGTGQGETGKVQNCTAATGRKANVNAPSPSLPKSSSPNSFVSSKNNSGPNTFSTINKRLDWSTKNTIACIIGCILCPLTVLGFIGCLPVYESFGWAFLVEFVLLAVFSVCLVLSPLLKPSWKVKNVVFMVSGLICVPVFVGLSIEDFEHNAMTMIFAVIGVLWVFAPFFKVDG